ncbi:hypothetical protein C8Q77DRAFT_1274101 [Trametes polyzona]|nr:hypothetical protein C8Q77DRAFT_1274101 [Trametes polyzona]
MHRKCMVIPTSQFLADYAPSASQSRPQCTSNILKDVPVYSGQEVKMYQPLVDALNNSRVCPKFEFAAISTRGHVSPTDWSTIELCIECKTHENSHDPFNETKPHNEPTTDDHKDTLGQIFSYAEFIFKRQQCTCIFMILLLGSCCRIVRFNRSGVIATEKFDYKTDGGNLIEFLWRYVRWDAVARGHDPSAQRIEPNSALGKKMQKRAQKDKNPLELSDYIRQMFEDSLTDKRWGWWKVRVDSEGEAGGSRFFLVGKPNFQAPGLAGCGTKGYVAADADNIDGPLFYLKDTWRVLSKALVEPEGSVLAYLNSKNVHNVPTLSFEAIHEDRRTLGRSPQRR